MKKIKTYPWREPRPANPVRMRDIKESFTIPLAFNHSVHEVESKEEFGKKPTPKSEEEIEKERLEAAGYPRREILLILYAKGFRSKKR